MTVTKAQVGAFRYTLKPTKREDEYRVTVVVPCVCEIVGKPDKKEWRFDFSLRRISFWPYYEAIFDLLDRSPAWAVSFSRVPRVSRQPHPRDKRDSDEHKVAAGQQAAAAHPDLPDLRSNILKEMDYAAWQPRVMYTPEGEIDPILWWELVTTPTTWQGRDHLVKRICRDLLEHFPFLRSQERGMITATMSGWGHGAPTVERFIGRRYLDDFDEVALFDAQWGVTPIWIS